MMHVHGTLHALSLRRTCRDFTQRLPLAESALDPRAVRALRPAGCTSRRAGVPRVRRDDTHTLSVDLFFPPADPSGCRRERNCLDLHNLKIEIEMRTGRFTTPLQITMSPCLNLSEISLEIGNLQLLPSRGPEATSARPILISRKVSLP